MSKGKKLEKHFKFNGRGLIKWSFFRDFSILAIFCFSALFACKTLQNSEFMGITKDQNGRMLVVEGKIELPKNADLYKRWRLFNMHWERLDNEESFENLDLENVKAEANKTPRLSITHLEDEDVAEFWIRNQLNYTKNEASSRFRDLAVSAIQVGARTDTDHTVVWSFTAELFSSIKEGATDSTLYSKGDRIRIPKKPVTVFFDELEIEDKYSDLLENQEKIWKILANTKKMKTTYFKVDGYSYGPFNYFYNHYTAKMSDETSYTLKVIDAMNSKVDISYPEYDKLTKDGTVSFYLFYGPKGKLSNGVKEEIYTSNKTMKFLIDNKFELESEASDNPRKFTRKVNDNLTFEVVLAVALPNLNQEILSALGKYEIVMYSGHAGYGSNISKSFTREEAYMDGYQLIYLKGCDTVKYGLNSVLRAKGGKSVSYFDVDLVATVGSGKGYQQNSAFIGSIIDGSIAYDAYKSQPKTASTDFQEHSWQSIVKKININDKHHSGDFQIHGADKNCFSFQDQHASDCVGLKVPSNIEELIKTLASSSNSTSEVKNSLIKSFMGAHLFSKDELLYQDMKKAIEKARFWCQELKKKRHDVSSIFYDNCSPIRLEVGHRVMTTGSEVGSQKITGLIEMNEQGEDFYSRETLLYLVLDNGKKTWKKMHKSVRFDATLYEKCLKNWTDDVCEKSEGGDR